MQAIERGISTFIKSLFGKKSEEPNLCDRTNTNAGYVHGAAYHPQPTPKNAEQTPRFIETTFENSFRDLGWGPPQEARPNMPPRITTDTNETQTRDMLQTLENHKILEFPTPDNT